MNHEIRYSSLLKNKSFRLYLYSSISGTFASGLNYIVIIWMILHINPSINSTLLGMILFWLPTVFLTPYFGALIDYSDRKRLTIAAELVRSIKFIIFGFLIWNNPTIWEIYLLALLSGCFAALYKPLGPALTTDLIGKEELLTGNTIIRTANQLGNIVGRGMFTILVFSLVTTYDALFIIAGLYLISAILLIPIKLDHIKHDYVNHQKDGILSTIIKGYQYLISHEKLIISALTQSLILFCCISEPVLVGPYVKNIIHKSNQFFGLCEGLLALGSLIGIITWTHIHKKMKLITCLLTSSIIAIISYCLLSNTNNAIIALISFFTIGFAWASYNLISTYVQTNTERNFQGRVQSAIHFDTTLTMILFATLLHFSSTTYTAQDAFLCLCIAPAILLIGSLFALFRTPRP